MESAALLRSFHRLTSPLNVGVEKPKLISVSNASLFGSGKFPTLGLATTGKIFPSSNKLGGRTVVSCVKTAEATLVAKLDDSSSKEPEEKLSLPRATFPDGIEELVQVFDETDIAELKLKFGDFEMYIKGKVEPPSVPSQFAYQAVAPAISSTAQEESSSGTVVALSSQKSSADKTQSFTHIDTKRATKLAILEASGVSSYLLAPSPTVGIFRTGRTLKGKKQPPVVKEGAVIKEGQTIGFVDQLGAELPVKSDLAGEVLKVLYDDGEPVGYGDPLIVVRA